MSAPFAFINRLKLVSKKKYNFDVKTHQKAIDITKSWADITWFLATI